MEYAAAKSSICRQCGRSFSPFVPKPGLKLRTKEETPRQRALPFLAGSRILEAATQFDYRCFECKRNSRSVRGDLDNLPACSTHIDLRDYKITSGFSRSIEHAATCI